MSTSTRSPRGARVIRLGVVLVVFGALFAVATAAFNLGVMHGTAATVVALLLYSVPATLLDWPRVTVSDVIELLSAIAGAIVSFFKSLFDW